MEVATLQKPKKLHEKVPEENVEAVGSIPWECHDNEDNFTSV